MDKQDAGIVGKRYALAALIAASSSVVLALSALIAAIPWERLLP